VTAVATGAFWSVAAAVASRAAGPGSSSRALGIVLGAGMLANVVGVPLGALAGQLTGWRGPFWALAVLAVAVAFVVAKFVPVDDRDPLAASLQASLWGFARVGCGSCWRPARPPRAACSRRTPTFRRC
jgi:predicted MFS family arabinose efflux permease